MISMLNPAIHLMNRLSFAKKLIVITLFFAIPIAGGLIRLTVIQNTINNLRTIPDRKFRQTPQRTTSLRDGKW
jgi:hypothetical protein